MARCDECKRIFDTDADPESGCFQEGKFVCEFCRDELVPIDTVAHSKPMSPLGQMLFNMFGPVARAAPKSIEQIRQELIDCLNSPWRVGICQACEEDQTTPGGNRCRRCEMQNLTKGDWAA